MATSPYLPIELHAEIRKCLHHYRDRSTLLSAALVSKEWSQGSQRILFSKVTDYWYQWIDQTVHDHMISSHTRFLQTILEHPRRLGRLVHFYAQYRLSFNPTAAAYLSLPKSGSDLWVLTKRALPVMVNLKHLYLEPLGGSNWQADVSLSALLNSVTFQLESFTWKGSYNPDTELSEFLKTQHTLLHLETTIKQNDLTFQRLDNSICQSLVSGSGSFTSLKHVARSRKIIAWKWHPADEEEDIQVVTQDSMVPGHLKYLSIEDYELFHQDVGPIELNIVLLELGDKSWDINPLESLSNMPSLRVLILPWDLHSYNTVGSQEITQFAIDCFKQSPNLEYIIQRNYTGAGDGYRCRKLTLSPISTEDILLKELMIDYDHRADWWTVYNV